MQKRVVFARSFYSTLEINPRCSKNVPQSRQRERERIDAMHTQMPFNDDDGMSRAK